MPSLVTYLAAGALVVLVMDAVAPPAGVGLSLATWPTVENEPTTQDPPQTVNRGGKGDRLPVPIVRRSIAPQAPHRILAGCEPVFSPLSAAAQLNHLGRCVAAIDARHPKLG
jgi:hypothetical protein